MARLRWLTLAGLSALLSAALLALHMPAAVLLGCGMGVGSPSLNAFMYELSEPAFRGLNANLMMLSLQGGSFLGPILGGAAVAAWGYDGFLLVGAGACLVGLVMSAGLGRSAPGASAS